MGRILTRGTSRATLVAMKLGALIIVLCQVGCLLQPEECGETFVEREGRCVPSQAPPPFVVPFDGDLSASDTLATSDAGLERDSTVDMMADDARVVPDMASPWAEYTVVLIVDRTADSDARMNPALPGADIDAVVVEDDTGERLGFAEEVLDSRINDPFQANIQTDPSAALLAPDGQAVSLGSQGGYIRLGLSLRAALRPGSLIVVTEIEEGAEVMDAYEAFLCRKDSEGLRGCRILGLGSAGGTSFLVPIE